MNAGLVCPYSRDVPPASPGQCGHTMTYVDTANPGWFSGSLTPFFGYGESHGWYTSSQYLNSITAGWEFGHGSYTASSWGCSRLLTTCQVQPMRVVLRATSSNQRVSFPPL
jgi:hypothetical protein